MPKSKIPKLELEQRIGNWTVMWVPEPYKQNTHCVCQCETCGVVLYVWIDNLIRGKTKGCGPCWSRSKEFKKVKGNLRHGHALHTISGRGTKEYQAWAQMLRRCNKPKCSSYPRYGGRGIKVCDRWNLSFEDFLTDLGSCPGPKYSLGRIDNDGNYEPGNVRWETPEQQHRNKSTSHLITFNGRTETLTEWYRITGIKDQTIKARIKMGWSVERALTEPTHRYTVTPESSWAKYTEKTPRKEVGKEELPPVDPKGKSCGEGEKN